MSIAFQHGDNDFFQFHIFNPLRYPNSDERPKSLFQAKPGILPPKRLGPEF
jgi:hypothetical protein